MHTYLIGMLACPVCHSELDWTITEQSEDRVEQAEARCAGCPATYPVRDGIGLFLTPDLPRNDLWAQVDSQLTLHLREHPEIDRQLMDGPLEELSPTDQHFRALVLEERGDWAGAQAAEDLANKNLYTPEYMSGWDSQTEYLLDVVSGMAEIDGPVVDLASGRCYLVEKLAKRLERPILATDFSPSVLRRDQKYLQFLGLYDRVSLLAFDARRTPFKDGVIPVLTTNVGLPNVEEPGRLLEELRRVVSGALLAITHFFPEDDEPNRQVIRGAGLEPLLYRQSALDQFVQAGWDVEVKNARLCAARPTPPSDIIEGARADGLPVADTTLEWCVLQATGKA
jgi:uncharacterized protein YbaR (Trm112 family)